MPNSTEAAEIDRGRVEKDKVIFNPISDPATEAPQTPSELPLAPEERIGFAVVALGRLTMEEILPAFSETKKAQLAGLVSGSPEKMRLTAERHGVPLDCCYSYAAFDQIADNDRIQAVYIVLPNSLHHEFTVRAAAAGKHVLCEKPMATSVADATSMVEACAAADVKLMIAYRCQYEQVNRHLVRLVRGGSIGPAKLIQAVNAQSQGEPGQWRLRRALSGGGALPDIGIYCLNTIRALLGEEPIEIEAQLYSTPHDPRFSEVEEAVNWLMRFPSGALASCATSYGAHKAQTLTVHTPIANITLENAFAYRGQQLKISQLADSQEVESSVRFSAPNQFALEIDHLAECILTGRTPHTPGEEGVQDHMLMEAIYRSASERRRIELPAMTQRDAFRGPSL